MTSRFYPARCLSCDGWRVTRQSDRRSLVPRHLSLVTRHVSQGAVALVLALTALLPVTAQQANPVRNADQEVNDARVREAQGLRPNENLLFNGWGMTPAGQHVTISDLPLKMVVSPDKKVLLAASAGYNDPGLSLLDIASRRVTQFFPLDRIWNGLAFSADGRRIFVSGGDSGKVHVFNYADGKATPAGSVEPSPNSESVFLAGIAVSPATGKVYVCNEGNDEIWVLDPKTLALEATVAVAEHPHSCLFGADKRHLYVSNWGSRSVSVVDTRDNRRVRNIPVGIRPNDMALAPDGRLFVACSGDNTVHVIQTQALEKLAPEASLKRRPPEDTREIISTSLYPASPEGSTPDGVAVSPDGKTLFVANADNNSVMVVDISNGLSEDARRNHESVSVVDGFIPVGWYPSAVCVSPDNNMLFVGQRQRPGLPSQLAPAKGKAQSRKGKPRAFDHVGSACWRARSRSSAGPTRRRWRLTRSRCGAIRLTRPEQFQRAPIHSECVIPEMVGQACPIKYVLYIIKENRTYDQVFGDFTQRRAAGTLGNGDPALTMYGENVTPNHHQLARDYVLLRQSLLQRRGQRGRP